MRNNIRFRASSLPPFSPQLESTEHSYYSRDSDSNYSRTSSMSTPIKKGSINVSHQTRHNLDPAVRNDFEGNINFDVSFLDFIKNVYAITDLEIKAIKKRDWESVAGEDNLRIYQQMVGQKVCEPERYGPFRRIVRALVDAFCKDGTVSFYLRMDGVDAIKDTFTTRKPDGYVLWEHTKPQWEVMKVAIEMKRGRARSDGETRHVMTNPERFMAAQLFTKPQSSQSRRRILPLPSHLNRLKDGGNQNDRTSAGPPTGSGSSSKGSSSRKRSHSPEPAVTTKRSRPSRLTIGQTQIANYALESMASACHRWTIGVMVDDFFVMVWYFDRMGAIVTERFDFIKSLWKLALLALALGRCTPAQAGYEPLIVEAGTEIDPTTGVLPFHRPLASVIGAEIILPADIRKLSKDDPRYTIVADALYIYRGATGRGTIVHPVQPTGGQDPGLELVVKWSWPIESRSFLEHELITHLRKTVPWMKEHLPEVIDHREFTLEDLDLPRCKFDDLSGAWKEERRKLAILVVPRYKHLWEVNSLAEFQNVFVDLVECHYHTYKWGHVMHRDLSEKNLMWRYSNDGIAKGILNDWDLSSRVYQPTVDIPAANQYTVDIPAANCRTGTTPFMACELLTEDKNPPTHLYRHDLESFFYILIWAMVHYNIGENADDLPACVATPPVLERWLSSDYQAIIDAKDSLLTNPTTPLSITSQVRPAFQPLIQTWFHPLLRLFREARNYSYDNAISPASDYDGETLGGKLTFEKFMEAIGRQPREIPSRYDLVYA